MIDVHQYHRISESTHRIMNPLAPDRLTLVGEICRYGSGSRILDLACGKGELLCQFAARSGAKGVGIDIYPPLLADARVRATELGVADRVEFLEGNAATPLDLGHFGVVSCLGASWIGGGLDGTLQIMLSYAERRAWLLVGEIYWARPPSDELATRYGQRFADLAGTLDVFETAGVDLVEMVLANDDDWDRYAASQWLNVANWLDADPDHPDAPAIRAERDESRRRYLTDERGTLGWGVFVGRSA
ncbi:MAG: SAM-dependent methyltransferase [Acidimicrobiales bacterium]|jgi:SAM-dependent methyltransferase